MSLRSLVLGLDVSPRRLGWGIVDLVTGEPIACGCEVLWPDPKVPVDWTKQRRLVQDALRVPHWHNAGVPCEVQAVYIEDTALAGKYRQHDAGRAQGIVQAEAERRWSWCDVQFLEVSKWKQLAGLKGNASKEDVYLRAIEVGFGQETMADQSRVLEWIVPGGQDAADAGLIAVAGQRRNQDTFDRSEAA